MGLGVDHFQGPIVEIHMQRDASLY